jgi:hypothetical protein
MFRSASLVIQPVHVGYVLEGSGVDGLSDNTPT